MPVNIYMNFNGDCRDAVEYYANVFGVPTPDIMTFGEGPSEPGFEMPEEMKNLVMHARINLYGSDVMFSDSMPGSPVTFGNNLNMTVVTTDLEKMKTDFEKLAKDGEVRIPLEKTFWSAAYGAIKDKFGIEWQFSYDDGSEMNFDVNE
ncbi:VOC family protein [Planococcus sp. YIM B11945]|uniref:VOC family protein n=1 Tax=Planococcus sp. YIM B11945 TaxID=3435410 RepID=UPI003D7ED079